jgi:uncharacterized protein YkwD
MARGPHPIRLLAGAFALRVAAPAFALRFAAPMVALPLASFAVAASAPAAVAAPVRCDNARVSPVDEPQLATTSVLCLLNRERAARHLPPLRISAALTQAARGHSNDMVRRRYFAHTTPGDVTFDHRIRRARYAADAKLGENLAWGMGDPALPIEILRGWMRSPEHRANILDGAFRSIGIGIARGVPVEASVSTAADGATYTTDFGSR